MATQFAYNAERAQDALGRMSVLGRSGSTAVDGNTLAQACIGAMISNDLMAAQAGAVPWVVLPDGSRGVIAVGGALDRIDSAPPEVRAIYKETAAIINGIHVRALGANASPNISGLRGGLHYIGPDEGIGFIPVLAYVAVVGIAAIVAGAWYAAETTKASVQVESTRLVQLAEVDRLARLASQQMAASGKVDSEIVRALDPERTGSAGAVVSPGSSPFTALGLPAWTPYALGAVGVAGGALWLRRKGIL